MDIARFDLKYSHGTLPHELLMRSIELYGTEVATRVRELIAEEAASEPSMVSTDA
jgi:hypothetical protein